MQNPLLLVVEDHPVTQKIIGLLCEEYGFNCVIVSTCAEAVAAIKETSAFSLVLMDLKLPDQSGIECSIELRNLTSDRNRIPIIAMSGLVDQQFACLQAGMDDVLTKPFSAREFQAMVLKYAGPSQNIVQFPSEDGRVVERDEASS